MKLELKGKMYLSSQVSNRENPSKIFWNHFNALIHFAEGGWVFPHIYLFLVQKGPYLLCSKH